MVGQLGVSIIPIIPPIKHKIFLLSSFFSLLFGSVLFVQCVGCCVQRVTIHGVDNDQDSTRLVIFRAVVDDGDPFVVSLSGFTWYNRQSRSEHIFLKKNPKKIKISKRFGFLPFEVTRTTKKKKKKEKHTRNH
jgi:hypothetical protein